MSILEYGGVFMEKIRAFKNWWDNTLWYHYKWHIIAGLFVVFCILYTVISDIGSVDPDYCVAYVGNSTNTEIVEQVMSESFKDEIKDLNEDEQKYLFVKSLLFGMEELKTQPMYVQQFDIDIISGQNPLYIMDADLYEFLKGREVFEPIEYNGESYEYIDISDNKLFTDDTNMFKNKYLVKRIKVAGEEKEDFYKEKVEITEKIIKKVLANH